MPRHDLPTPERDRLQYLQGDPSVQAGCYRHGLRAVAGALAGLEEGCEAVRGGLIVAPMSEAVPRAATRGDELISSGIDLDRRAAIRSGIFDLRQHRQPERHDALTPPARPDPRAGPGVMRIFPRPARAISVPGFNPR